MPDPQGSEESLAHLLQAPIGCFCSVHADQAGDRYARAVAWTLITQYGQGMKVELHEVQALCDQLQEMPTDIAQATHAILSRLEGIE